jgi:hypothetical protein
LASLFVLIALALPLSLTASADKDAEPPSTRQKIQALLQSSPWTTNLQTLEIYDTQAPPNAPHPVRKEVIRLPYFNEGDISATPMVAQVLLLPERTRFFIEELGPNESPRYYGPFEGNPFTVLAAPKQTKSPKPPRPANSSVVNAVPPVPDNPLGLDIETISRLFQTGKQLRNVAMMASQWSASHQLRIPVTLDEVYANYINRDELAIDPFSGSKFEIKNALGRIQIYSVGPDGVYDEGMPIAPDDPALKGDLGVEIEVGGNAPQWLLVGDLIQYLEGTHTARYLAARTKRSSETPAPTPNRADENLHFGKVIDGLSAAVELLPTNDITAAAPPSHAFSLDQPIQVRFHIRNEANYDIQIASDNWRQGDKPIIETETGLLATDDRGRPIIAGTSHYSGISPLQRQILKPGQSITLRSSALEFLSPQGQASYPVGYTAMAKPGRYNVRFKLIFRGWNADVMDWQGELETGPATVTLQPASPSKPTKSTR